MSYDASVESYYRLLSFWRDNRVREAGQPDLFTSHLVWEVPAVPDFSSSRFSVLGDSHSERYAKLAEGVENFLQGFHSSGAWNGVALRLVRTADEPQYISAFLVISVSGTEPLSLARLDELRRSYHSLLPNASHYTYIYLDPIARSGDAAEHECAALHRARMQLALSVGDWASYGLELCKKIDFLPTAKKLAPAALQDAYVSDVWGVPARRMKPKANSLERVCASLLEQPGTTMVDITLRPAEPHGFEKGTVNERRGLYEMYSREQRFGNVVVPADRNAAQVLDLYDELQTALTQSGPWFLYAIRVFSSAEAPSSVINTLAAEANAHEMAVVALHADGDLFERSLDAVEKLEVLPDVNQGLPDWLHPETHQELYRLHRMATGDELTGFWTLPVPRNNRFPGFDLDYGQSTIPLRTKRTAEHSIPLGQGVSGRPVSLRTRDIPRHMLVVGTPGSGKTSTIFHVLHHLWKQRISWLVLEPAKTEYRALRALLPDLLVFTLGDERTVPFRFNPFEVPHNTPVERHISRLNTCFAGAFNLFDPMPMLLDKAIRLLYTKKGWSTYDLGGEARNPPAPILSELVPVASQVLDDAGYIGEIGSNIRASLLNRLESLQRGSIGRMLDTSTGVPLDELLRQPVVLEMDALSADEKSLMMMFVFTHIYEYAKANRSSNSGLQHALVIEEAHNVIGSAEPGREDRANPRKHAVELFATMLAEMRSLGQGIVIVDQLPSALAPQAMKNTNVKIVHQLTAGDDREAVGLTMGLRADDPKNLEPVSFTPGEAFLFAPTVSGAEITRIQVTLDSETERVKELPSPSDTVLRQGAPEFPPMLDYLEDHPKVFMPFAQCERYCRHCAPAVRESSQLNLKRWLKQSLASVSPKGVLYDFRRTRDPEERSDYDALPNDVLDAEVVANLGGVLANEVARETHRRDSVGNVTLQCFCAYVHFMNCETGLACANHESVLSRVVSKEDSGGY